MRRLPGLVFCCALCLPAFPAENILILPFFNLSQTKNIDWIGDSISETIFESLASEGALAVRPENRDETLREMGVLRYARLTRASAIEIAVNLDAAVVVYGDFDLQPPPAGSNSQGLLRIQARIVNARQMKRGPEYVQAGPLEDLSRLQTRLAWQLLRALQPESQVSEDEFLRAHPPIRLDALESYVRGLLATVLEQKLSLFGQAARLEPGFSQPCFQLGKLHYGRKDFRAAAEWLQKVSPGDSRYREALFYLGLSRFYMADFAAARMQFERVAEATPLSEVFNNLGAAQLRAGDPAALGSFLKAIEADPADPLYHFNAGYALWRRGEFAPAAERFAAVLERDPDDESAAQMLDRCRKQAGPRPADPRAENLERLKTNYDETAWLHLKAILAAKPQSP